MNEQFQPGDVVQIVDEAHSWYPCLLLVGKVKSWGVQACALIPKSNDGSERPAEAWNRLKFEQVARIGEAHVCHPPETE